jgi:mannose-6-phosphate isomerase-like protein (cupin superfamily)
MYTAIRSGELPPSANGTVTFIGEKHGSPISCFLVNTPPGTGPNLHRHPYVETWFVQSGLARITIDNEELEAGPGDILVVSPNTPHKFKNIGTERLNIICVHASPQFIQEDLE